jgi:hypothetical protein
MLQLPLLNMKPLLLLYDETDFGAVRLRIAAGCAAVIRGSTWGWIRKDTRRLSEDNIATIAEAMTAYILAPVEKASGVSVQLSGKCYLVGQVLDVDEFARVHSGDFVFECTSFNEKATAAHDARYLEDEATAAILFGYKYGLLAEEYFQVGGIAEWARLISASRGEQVCAMKVLHLLDTLDSLADVGTSSSG